jgi:hypothetical protein
MWMRTSTRTRTHTTEMLHTMQHTKNSIRSYSFSQKTILNFGPRGDLCPLEAEDPLRSSKEKSLFAPGGEQKGWVFIPRRPNPEATALTLK